MPDRYRDFRELEKAEPEGDAWTRDYVNRGSRTLVMAPHGGWIEPFTAELALGAAGSSFSVYTFQGLKRRGNETLHLTSHRFDEPLALRAVSSAEWVVAIHGERSSEREFVMVGGLWRLFRERMSEALEGAAHQVVTPREGLGGVNPQNICNRGQTLMGGQLEISEGLRQALRHDPDRFESFSGLIRDTLIRLEAAAGGGP